jgi:hypothetical protein
LRGECRAISGVTVVTNSRVYYTSREAAGASGARHSPRPLFIGGRKILAELGRIARENAALYLSVIASEAKQSSFFLGVAKDCFAEPVIGRAFARPVGSQ